MKFVITAGTPSAGVCIVEAVEPGGHGAQYRGWYDARRREWRLYAVPGSYLPAGQARKLIVPESDVRIGRRG